MILLLKFKLLITINYKKIKIEKVSKYTSWRNLLF